MPRKYQRLVIRGVNDRRVRWSEELQEIQREERAALQRQINQVTRRRRTTRYSQSDLEFFDRVEELTKLTKAQLIEHIIRLEHSLEHLQ